MPLATTLLCPVTSTLVVAVVVAAVAVVTVAVFVADVVLVHGSANQQSIEKELLLMVDHGHLQL